MSQLTLEQRVRVLEDTVAALVVGRTAFDLVIGEELHRIASLQENWDFEGAYAIEPAIVAAAGVRLATTRPAEIPSSRAGGRANAQGQSPI